MPALPAAFMYQLQARYLQNQGIIWPQVITGAIGNILNAVINYVFLYPLNLGVAGSAAANAISQYILAITLFVYIYVRGLHKATWSGWSRECLQEWGSFIHLAIPSMLMLCLEWWMFEVGGFLAGIISEGELGSQSVIYELAVVAYMVPLGLSAASSVRVGNALGAGNVEQAKLSAKVPVVCGFFIACVVGAIIVALKDYLAYIFTTEREIIDRVSEVMVVFCFAHVGDAVAGVSGGVVRGAGKQKFGALCNLIGYYFIGFPIGASLMFAAKMGIVGLWTGLFICVVVQSIFFIIFLCKLNWTQASKEAQIRAGVQIKDEAKTKNTGSKKEEVASVETANEAPDDCLQFQDQFTCTVDHTLSSAQLVLRRGLALLIMLIILCVGIVCHFFLITLVK